MKRTNRNFAGKSLLFVVFLLAALFLLFGISIAFVGISNFMKANHFSFIDFVYIVAGAYIAFVSVARFLRFHNTYNWDSYEKSSKFFRMHRFTILVTVVLFILFYFILDKEKVSGFDFVLSVIVYLPEFVLENMVFAIKVYSTETFRPLAFYSLFDFILPISEFIYLFFISSFFVKLKKKLTKSP